MRQWWRGRNSTHDFSPRATCRLAHPFSGRGVPPAGPRGSSGPALLCFFMPRGPGSHPSVRAWRSPRAFGEAGRGAVFPNVQALPRGPSASGAPGERTEAASVLRSRTFQRFCYFLSWRAKRGVLPGTTRACGLSRQPPRPAPGRRGVVWRARGGHRGAGRASPPAPEVSCSTGM